MSQHQCYLAGPMDPGETWRATASRFLEGSGVKVVMPEFLERYVQRFGVTAEEAGKILTARDRRFASESDYVLVNFTGSESRSMGTCVELGWADNGHTITVAVNPPGNPHHGHPIVHSVCDFTVDTLAEALYIIEALSWRNS